MNASAIAAANWDDDALIVAFQSFAMTELESPERKYEKRSMNDKRDVAHIDKVVDDMHSTVGMPT
jgi:hypothetical protein